jgi:2-amino-4-hydroxy-6-hydroxymethyldihydropteridine diphosphokinase
MCAVIGTIGLGSNLGDRWGHLRHGLRGLSRVGARLLAMSSVWESEPVDSPAREWFLNMAVRFDTDRDPLALLDDLLTIEREAGRVRDVPNGPRTLDLDLLTLGELRIRDPRLCLPHPRMWERRFVLEPLAEIAPSLRNPATGRTVVEEAWRLRGRSVVYRVGSLPLPEASLYNPASTRSSSTHEVQIDRG